MKNSVAFYFCLGLTFAGIFSSGAPNLQAQEGKLTIASWSGTYLRSQILGYIKTFEKETGIEVEVVSYTGGIEEIREQVYARNVKWDVIDLELFDAIRAHQEGLLVPIPLDSLPQASDGTPAISDFIQGTLFEFGVGTVTFATVVGYNRNTLNSPPDSLEDFFDLRKYPGARGLRRTPQINLEWALIADGIEPKDVYDVLETEEGLDRAFNSLDRIKPQIVWWETGLEAIRLLERGEVVMSSAWSGRMYTGIERGLPIDILWDHQVWQFDVWSIVRHTENLHAANKFIQYASRAESMVRQTHYIPYGPVRKSAISAVAEPVRSRLPTAPENFKTAFEGNAEWWAENLDRIQARFNNWLRQPVMVPRRFPR